MMTHLCCSKQGWSKLTNGRLVASSFQWLLKAASI